MGPENLPVAVFEPLAIQPRASHYTNYTIPAAKKFTLEQAKKAQRGSKGIILLFL
jgi:hypothetical protein